MDTSDINIYINIYSEIFGDLLAKVRAQKMTAVICHNCHFFCAHLISPCFTALSGLWR